VVTTLETRRTEQPIRLLDWFESMPLSRWFEGLRPMLPDVEMIRVEQRVDQVDGHDVMTIRAEMPGIDPERDVDITVADGLLTIRAERRAETTTDENGRTRSEFHYGSFSRTLAVPKDLDADAITAGYTDGILEVRFPVRAATETTPKKITVSRS
jgi:HSP20 family protein